MFINCKCFQQEEWSLVLYLKCMLTYSIMIKTILKNYLMQQVKCRSALFLKHLYKENKEEWGNKYSHKKTERERDYNVIVFWGYITHAVRKNVCHDYIPSHSKEKQLSTETAIFPDCHRRAICHLDTNKRASHIPFNLHRCEPSFAYL